MTIYLALLRGINVGGHKKIKMADLKAMLTDMGLGRVQTYIQSGNVLFESDDEAESLQTKIEQEIERVFRFSVAVMLRTSDEWKSVIEHCSYSADDLAEGESIHVTFLTEAPAQEDLDQLPDLSGEIDEYQIIGRELYMHLRQSILDSKVPTKLSKLGAPQTSRNWKTVVKLASMVEAMEV
jgi:uncharacterized protein (DUF1697 family)